LSSEQLLERAAVKKQQSAVDLSCGTPNSLEPQDKLGNQLAPKPQQGQVAPSKSDLKAGIGYL